MPRGFGAPPHWGFEDSALATHPRGAQRGIPLGLRRLSISHPVAVPGGAANTTAGKRSGFLQGCLLKRLRYGFSMAGHLLERLLVAALPLMSTCGDGN